MFNTVDVVALIVLVVGMLQGLQRRLSGELAHLVGVGVAFVVGVFSYRPLGNWLVTQGWVGERAGQTMAFAAAILVAAVAMIAARIVLTRILGAAIGEGTDRTAGAVAGLVKATIVILIVFIAMNLAPNATLNRVFGEESAIGRMAQVFLPDIREKVESLDAEKLEQIKDGTGLFQEDAGGDSVPVRRR